MNGRVWILLADKRRVPGIKTRIPAGRVALTPATQKAENILAVPAGSEKAGSSTT